MFITAMWSACLPLALFSEDEGDAMAVNSLINSDGDVESDNESG